MKKIITANTIFLLVIAGCSVEREETNPVVHSPNGTLDAHLSATIVYGVGLELNWETPAINELERLNIYKGAANDECQDMDLLATATISETSYLDEQVEADIEYAYCLTAGRGTTDSPRIGAPVIKQTHRVPGFVVNNGKYLTSTEEIPVQVLYRQELFSPTTLLVSIDGSRTEVPFALQTTLDIAGTNGEREISLSLKDASGIETKPQLFDIYLCKSDVEIIDNDEDGYPGGEPLGDCPGLLFDCDDDDQATHPNADELCDGVDRDCDGEFDEDFDADKDTYTTCGTRTTDGSSTTADCDDGDADINPEATEVCDGVDQDCDGVIDNGFDAVVRCGPTNQCCASEEVCFSGNCCLPNCTGKVCGDDGCGGTCGACVGATVFCNQLGQCIDDCEGRECGASPTQGFLCGICADILEACLSGLCMGREPLAGDLVLNEFFIDPPLDISGDSNCDGIRHSSDDEFVEIVNVSGYDLNLSGVTISDSYLVRHDFQAFSLPAGGVVVVYGGGDPNCTWQVNVQAVVASSGALALNNNGDSITMTSADGTTELIAVTYPSDFVSDESMTLSPDLDTSNPYTGHTAADTIDGSPFSPGTAINGSALVP